MFGKSAPDPKALVMADRVLKARAHYGAFCTNRLGPALSTGSCVSALTVIREEDGGIFVATTRFELPGPLGF